MTGSFNDGSPLILPPPLQVEVSFLRKEFPEYKVEFERNVGILNKNKGIFTKKEIDIIVYKDLPEGEKDFFWAIEFCCTRNNST